MSLYVRLWPDVALILSNLLSYYIILGADQCSRFDATVCRCKFNDGGIIDLTSISPVGDPLFLDRPATKIYNDTSKYSYNPCFDFKEGKDGCQNGVTVCQTQGIYQYALGHQSSSVFWYDEVSKKLFLTYKENTRVTRVTLNCSKTAKQPEFEVLGESKPGSSENYSMILTTRCACPNECIEEYRGLSTGSVLVVLFFVFSAVYFFGGVAYLKIVRGASGTEMIPNYDFWIDFPLLVRDGIVFLFNCCRAETTYERI